MVTGVMRSPSSPSGIRRQRLRSGLFLGPARRFPDDQMGKNRWRRRGEASPEPAILAMTSPLHASHFANRLTHRGQRRAQPERERTIIEADDSQIIGNFHTPQIRRSIDAGGGFVIASENGRGSRIERQQQLCALLRRIRKCTTPRQCTSATMSGRGPPGRRRILPDALSTNDTWPSDDHRDARMTELGEMFRNFGRGLPIHRQDQVFRLIQRRRRSHARRDISAAATFPRAPQFSDTGGKSMMPSSFCRVNKRRISVRNLALAIARWTTSW